MALVRLPGAHAADRVQRSLVGAEGRGAGGEGAKAEQEGQVRRDGQVPHPGQHALHAVRKRRNVSCNNHFCFFFVLHEMQVLLQQLPPAPAVRVPVPHRVRGGGRLASMRPLRGKKGRRKIQARKQSQYFPLQLEKRRYSQGKSAERKKTFSLLRLSPYCWSNVDERDMKAISVFLLLW